MSQRVPSCDVDDNHNYIPTPTKFSPLPNSNFTTHEVPMLNYQVGVLPCKKGQSTTHEEHTAGNIITWEKHGTNDTLESIVNQHVIFNKNCHNKLVTMDATVPCFSKQSTNKVVESERVGACMKGSSPRVASSSDEVARVPVTRQLSGSRDWSVSGSETYPKEFSVAFNSASMGSPENTTNDDRDSIRHRESQSETRNEDYKTTRVDRSSESNKRIKASAIHNQSERRRRDKINQRMKELQKLVPNSSKSDKASVLDDVIQYLKQLQAQQLQAQLQMMNWMKLYSSMMLPITMQQQHKMSMMMAQMCFGMGMNKDMVMNMNGMVNIPGIPPVLHPTPFMSMPSCANQFHGAPEKSVGMDAYSRMAALYQQLYNPPASSSKT